MKVLLDTCTVVELRNPRGNPAVKAAIAVIPDEDLFLGALFFGEVAKGIAALSDGRKKRSLSAWLTGLEHQFAERVLPVDGEIARLWGDVLVRTHRAGVVLGVIDGLLAATALRHGLHVMTHNTPSLAATGALIVDPWKESGEG